MGATTLTAARLNSSETLSARILKVDHAGEHGAVNIYRGQQLVCRWRHPSLLSELSEFQSHEEKHRTTFWRSMQARGIRRCRSYHLCGAGGFVLGLVTGLLGKSAIAATTCAVERVVLRHLDEQLAYLSDRDPDAFNVISSILEDERAHHDRGAQIAAQNPFWMAVLGPIVSASTECVIWLGMRL